MFCPVRDNRNQASIWSTNISFNKKLKKYCEKNGKIEFADVWYPMLDNNGNVFKDVFLEDGLHMNKKGYDIWGKVIGGFLNEWNWFN